METVGGRPRRVLGRLTVASYAVEFLTVRPHVGPPVTSLYWRGGHGSEPVCTNKHSHSLKYDNETNKKLNNKTETGKILTHPTPHPPLVRVTFDTVVIVIIF